MLNANPQDLPLSGHPPSWLKRNAASRWTGPLMLDAHEVLALFYAARGDGKARTRHADEVLLCKFAINSDPLRVGNRVQSRPL
jgi:hypothetical protein